MCSSIGELRVSKLCTVSRAHASGGLSHKMLRVAPNDILNAKRRECVELYIRRLIKDLLCLQESRGENSRWT